MSSLPLKTLAAAIGLAVALAAPADAKSRKHKQAAGKPAAATIQSRGQNVFPGGPIYFGNRYLGNDPDPFIRSQILRDPNSIFGGND